MVYIVDILDGMAPVAVEKQVNTFEAKYNVSVSCIEHLY